MSEFTTEQLAYITEQFLQDGSPTKAQRAFKRKYKVEEAPSAKVIIRCARNFREIGSITTKKSTGRPTSVRTEENADRAKEIVSTTMNTSSLRIAQKFEISKTLVLQILKKDLRFKPYK